MKLILLLFCEAAIFRDFAYGRIDPTKDVIVGISQQKLLDYVTKAIKGFRKVILEGDEELDYPVMDPYDIKVFFDQVDASGKNKYRLNFYNKNTTIIRGLADYTPKKVKVNAKDMSLSFEIIFNSLEIEFPYKLDGHFFKNFMPVYGDGIVKFFTENQSVRFSVDLTTKQGYIVVEEVQTHRYLNDIDVEITGLMDLHDPFANVFIDDVLDYWLKQYGSKVLNNYVQDLVEEVVAGMTMEEFFDYLDHFVQKYNEQ